MRWSITFEVEIEGYDPEDKGVQAYLADAATAMAIGAEAWVAPSCCTVEPTHSPGFIALSWTGQHGVDREDVGIVDGLVKQADELRSAGVEWDGR